MHRILVIDDEVLILDIVEQALSIRGYEVETAATGQAGIRRYNSGIFDAVITDICMPDVDGLTVLHHIRSSNRGMTPVVGMSGTPWLLNGAGFDRVLPKPFSLDTLWRSLDRLFNGSAKKQDPSRRGFSGVKHPHCTVPANRPGAHQGGAGRDMRRQPMGVRGRLSGKDGGIRVRSGGL